MGNGVSGAEVLAVAGNETGYGWGICEVRQLLRPARHGSERTYRTKDNGVPVQIFPVATRFIDSGRAFVNNVQAFLQPGMGANPLAFFTILNQHGYATGNPGYPAYMVGTGKNRGPYTQVTACTGGGI